MKQKEIIRHLKTRWQAVRRIEKAEMKKTSLAEKLNLTSAVFGPGKLLNLPFQKRKADVKTARERWRRLKNLSYGEK